MAEGCTIAHSIEPALIAAGNVSEIAIIGGAQIFEELLPRTDVLKITYVHAEIDGDTFFPPLSPDDWHEHERRRWTNDCLSAFVRHPISAIEP